MKITFHGTNGWFTTSAGRTLCLTVETDGFFIILDAGDGFFSIPADAAGDRKAYLLLSHFHMDHIAGLHGLSRMSFPHGLVIIGGRGTRDIISHIVAHPFTVALEELPYPVEIIELDGSSPSLPFDLEWRPMLHADPCLGYRISFRGSSLAFCTDTGPCPEAIELGCNTDLLVTECSYLPGEKADNWPHLNPETAAGIALSAGTKRLVLTHFDAARYLDQAARELAEKRARAVFPEAFSSYDGLTIEI